MTKRRLIEEALPLEAVNAASAREKSLRHGHISTMHLWWARRPLAMSRAVVLGTLLPDPGDDERRNEILDLIAQGSEFEAASDPTRMNPLRKLLADAYPDGPPKVLDCFAGGGAIPLEALRLGCDTTALELNPVAHLIEKGCLEYPQRYGQPDPTTGQNRLAEDFLYWANWVRDEVRDDLAAVFPSSKAAATCGLLLVSHDALPESRLRSRYAARQQPMARQLDYTKGVDRIPHDVQRNLDHGAHEGTPAKRPGKGHNQGFVGDLSSMRH